MRRPRMRRPSDKAAKGWGGQGMRRPSDKAAKGWGGQGMRRPSDKAAKGWGGQGMRRPSDKAAKGWGGQGGQNEQTQKWMKLKHFIKRQWLPLINRLVANTQYKYCGSEDLKVNMFENLFLIKIIRLNFIWNYIPD